MPVSEALQAAHDYFKAGKLGQAEKIYAQILAVEPQHPDALYYTGAIADQLGLPGAADYMRQAVAINPNHAPYLNNLGVLLRAQGDFREALEYLRRSVVIDPDYAIGHYNLALLLLLYGEFSQGWTEYEWRWKTKPFQASQLHSSKPRWDGSELHGRTLLIHAEQGIGDTFQFVRYLFVLAKNEPGAKLIFLCKEETEEFFRRSLAQHCVVASDVQPSAFDVWYPLMSLPLRYRTSLENIPDDIPYLAPSRRKLKEWRNRLQTDIAPVKVGLVWAGNKANKSDRRRSILLSNLTPLHHVVGASFYSLQTGEPAQQASACGELRLTNLTDELRDFDDTAALIAHLDLVISVDTAVAHLAGAMGKPVWVMLPFDPDWRWMLGRENSPWYPTMKLFRQSRIGQWKDVVARLADELSDFCANQRKQFHR